MSLCQSETKQRQRRMYFTSNLVDRAFSQVHSIGSFHMGAHIPFDLRILRILLPVQR